MLSHLALLSLASAAVEVDFRVGNSYELNIEGKSLAGHQVHKRGVAGSNDTIEPVINATLTPSYNFYYGDLLVGQPPQKFEVLLDTGSPVSWLYGPQGSYHNASRFFPNRSLTYKEGNSSFSAEYGSGIYLGHWGSDLVAAPQFVASNVTHNVTLNNTSNSTNSSRYNLTWDLSNSTLINTTAINTTLLSGNVTALNATALNTTTHNRTNISILPFSVPFEFGVVSSFSTAAGAPGLLGLGPHIEGAGPKGYNSLPEAYKKYNVTSSSAFSVFLEKKNGRFLFGGADLKYVDLPFYRYAPRNTSDDTQPSSWTLRLDSLAVNGKHNTSINSTATLDTGSPVSLLPHNFVDEVGKAFNLAKNDKFNAYYVKDGKIPRGTISIRVNGGLEVKADISSFFVPGEYIWLKDGPKNVTALGLLGSSSYLLGDAFFRNTYTILDPSNGEVLVAKRSHATINATNSTNATTVIAIDRLLKNKTAVVDISSHLDTRPKKHSTKSTSLALPQVNSEAFVANQYIGTVPANKAASVTEAAASGSATSSSESSGSASSSSSKSTSTKSSNAGVVNGVSSSALLIAAPLLLLI